MIRHRERSTRRRRREARMARGTSEVRGTRREVWGTCGVRRVWDDRGRRKAGPCDRARHEFFFRKVRVARCRGARRKAGSVGARA